MLGTTRYKKHKCLIALIYTCGLRRSKAINLTLEDIDSKRMMIRLRAAKGDKDRYVNFPASLLVMLREYHLEFKPKVYVFEGHNGGKYSAESVWNVIKQAAMRTGIRKRVYPHVLPRTTWNKGLTFVIFRSGWDTKALKQHSAIHM